MRFLSEHVLSEWWNLNASEWKRYPEHFTRTVLDSVAAWAFSFWHCLDSMKNWYLGRYDNIKFILFPLSSARTWATSNIPTYWRLCSSHIRLLNVCRYESLFCWPCGWYNRLRFNTNGLWLYITWLVDGWRLLLFAWHSIPQYKRAWSDHILYHIYCCVCALYNFRLVKMQSIENTCYWARGSSLITSLFGLGGLINYVGAST